MTATVTSLPDMIPHVELLDPVTAKKTGYRVELILSSPLNENMNARFRFITHLRVRKVGAREILPKTKAEIEEMCSWNRLKILEKFLPNLMLRRSEMHFGNSEVDMRGYVLPTIILCEPGRFIEL